VKILTTNLDLTLLSRVEDAGLNASAPAQQLWIDGWLVRFSPGKAKRARCVNAVASGRLPMSERLSACERVFAAAGLPLIVRITPFTEPVDLDGWLQRQGMHRFDDTRVMLLESLSGWKRAPDDGNSTFQAIGLEAFAQRIGGLRGSHLAQRQAHAERLLNSPVPFFAFQLHVDGDLVACGQIALEGRYRRSLRRVHGRSVSGQRICQAALSPPALRGKDAWRTPCLSTGRVREPACAVCVLPPRIRRRIRIPLSRC
jgi:hypothetical protein